VGVKQTGRVFESEVLSRIFATKGDGVTGGQRKLYNVEFNNLYSLLNIISVVNIKEDEMDGACSMQTRDTKCI
jgi:hypothetical protein